MLQQANDTLLAIDERMTAMERVSGMPCRDLDASMDDMRALLADIKTSMESMQGKDELIQSHYVG